MIPVTKPFLPPQEEYLHYLEGIWQRNWLTNNGPLVNELELRLRDYLDVPYMLFLGNGTIALQIAIKALELQGEIITTPFSYVATTSSIVWEGCTPIFVDIDPGTFNIDPTKIEAEITEKTSAILATHVYGNPCDIDAIQEIADRYDLKVIYDAAHCFGSTYKGKSVFAYGDISTASFHATKLFHTTEGGGLFTKDRALLKKMKYMRNFGHDGPEKFAGVGINGKNSEFHAAMGLVNLKYVDEVMQSRKRQHDYYAENLKGEGVQLVKDQEGSVPNRSYFAVLLPNESTCITCFKIMEQMKIFPRRYFYPSLETLDYVVSDELPVSQDVASRILCLPMYHTLSIEEQDLVLRTLKTALRDGL